MFVIEVQLVRKALFKMSNEERAAFIEHHEEEFNKDKDQNRWSDTSGNYASRFPEWLVAILKRHMAKWWYDENNQVYKCVFPQSATFEDVQESRDSLYNELNREIKADSKKLAFTDDYLIQANILEHNEESVAVDEELVNRSRDAAVVKKPAGRRSMDLVLFGIMTVAFMAVTMFTLITKQPESVTLCFGIGTIMLVLATAFLSVRKGSER